MLGWARFLLFCLSHLLFQFLRKIKVALRENKKVYLRVEMSRLLSKQQIKGSLTSFPPKLWNMRKKKSIEAIFLTFSLSNIIEEFSGEKWNCFKNLSKLQVACIEGDWERAEELLKEGEDPRKGTLHNVHSKTFITK